MAHLRSSKANGRFVGGPAAPVAAKGVPALAREIPPVVYFVRARGLIKIGHTVDLNQRKRHYGASWDDVLAFTPGTRDDEAAMHQRFASHLAEGDEWFHPAPEILDLIDEIRAGYQLPPVERAAFRAA